MDISFANRKLVTFALLPMPLDYLACSMWNPIFPWHGWQTRIILMSGFRPGFRPRNAVRYFFSWRYITIRSFAASLRSEQAWPPLDILFPPFRIQTLRYKMQEHKTSTGLINVLRNRIRRDLRPGFTDFPRVTDRLTRPPHVEHCPSQTRPRCALLLRRRLFPCWWLSSLVYFPTLPN